jgi:hypothetical protein
MVDVTVIRTRLRVERRANPAIRPGRQTGPRAALLHMYAIKEDFPTPRIRHLVFARQKKRRLLHTSASSLFSSGSSFGAVVRNGAAAAS